MTDEARERAVEAAAMVVRAGSPCRMTLSEAAGTAREAIDAYEAAMAEAGWVMVRDCVGREMTGGNGIVATIHRAYDEGWNACRAAMLKGAGDEQG